MNTQDFKPFIPSWEEIFEKQRELKFMYEPEAKDLFKNFDIDCFEDQELFKKYCWRITEELSEAIEAQYEFNLAHLKEELIDAMNFTIELMLLYGWSAKDFDTTYGHSYPDFGDNIWNRVGATIYGLGLTANCLKNRQWRKSQYLVDLLIFERRFKEFLLSEYFLLRRLFGSDEDIREAWSLKYQVNLFRIQSNY